MARTSLPSIALFALLGALVALSGCQSLPGSVPREQVLEGIVTYQDGVAVAEVMPKPASALIAYHSQQPLVQGDQMTVRFADVQILPPLEDIPDVIEEFFSVRGINLSLPRKRASRAHYTIEKNKAEEWVEGRWVAFSEFDLDVKPTAKIGVVLVLDTSRSIDGQLAQARYVSDRLLGQMSAHKQWHNLLWVSIQLLDESIPPLPFTQSYNEVHAYLEGIDEYTPYTALYAAIVRGCESFDEFQGIHTVGGRVFEFDKRWMVLVSDGQDNYSREDRDQAVKAVAEAGVSVYAIGVEAEDILNQDGLKELAQDRLVSIAGLSTEDLRAKIDAVLQQIAVQTPTQYTVEYRRNDQIIVEPRPFRLVFAVEEIK